MSLSYLKQAVADNDIEPLIRYVRLHLGDGDESVGKKEIDKSWIEALRQLLDMPPTDQQFIHDTLQNQSSETLAHLYFHLHFHLAKLSGDWIHDGNL